MFWKKKEPEKKRELPKDSWYIGEPELSAGKTFYPVYKKRWYWGFMALGYRLEPWAECSEIKIKYFRSKLDAEKYIKLQEQKDGK